MAEKTEKRKTGRPKADIDWNRVGEMLEAGCSTVGIAATIGIDEETLRKRCPGDNNCTFSAFSQAKKAKGNEMLREVQFTTAIGGDRTMLIWLGKQRLEQTDKSEVKKTEDPVLTQLQGAISKRAIEKGTTYEAELQYVLDNFGVEIKPEIKAQLTSNLIQ